MRHYLDHAASAPLRREARAAFERAASVVGNPTSLHASGRRAHAALEDAREELADAVGADPVEVVWTSGGTESDNLVVLGGARWGRDHGRPRVAASTVEHPAVAEAVRSLGERAAWLEVDGDGVVTSDALDALAGGGGDVAWASMMWVNNETGAVQPVVEFVEACRRAGVRAHSDGVQALGHLAVDFAASGLDALSLSAHKVGGPVGVGALVVRRDAPLVPVSWGGGQERRLRSGTPPVALAAAFAAAATAAVAEREGEAARLGGLRDRLVAGLSVLAGVRVNGPDTVSPAICHVTIDGCRADDVLLLLDAAGIDCSTGSACTAGVHQPSRVLLAMGRPEADAVGSLRFSFGPTTDDTSIDALLAALPEAVVRARAAAAYNRAS